MNKTEIKLGLDHKDKIKIFIYFLIIAYSILFMRLFYLQIIKGKEYKKRSEENRVRVRIIESPRGKIYDKNGKLLVTNVAGYRLVYLNGRESDDKILKEISELTSYSIKSVKKRIKYGEIYKYTGENILEKDLKPELAHKIMEKLDDYNYLDVIYYPKRKYLYKDIGSHILGYVKTISKNELETLKSKGYNEKDLVGKKGIEKQYESILQGIDGYEYIEVNVFNKKVKNIDRKDAIPGKDLYLSIDIDLQEFVTKLFDGKKGAFVAMKTTGEILTMVSVPEYDLNIFTSRISEKVWKKILKDPRKPLQNRLIVSTYPPGSIFKPLTAMAILKSNISPEESINDPGYFKIGAYRWNDWKLDGHGIVNLEKAIVQSCNTYFISMADKIGHEKIVEISRAFGLGELTGIDIPNEKNGLVPDKIWKRTNLKENWYKGDTLNLAIGQGYLLTTPMQMAKVYQIFANNGKVYKPFLLKKIKYSDGKEIEIKPKLQKELKFEKEAYDIINSGMRKVVTDGTGRKLKSIKKAIVGKTGSAENAHYRETHSWFAGFSEYEKPDIIVVVFVEGGGHGSATAVPIAKKFFQRYYSKKDR